MQQIHSTRHQRRRRAALVSAVALALLAGCSSASTSAPASTSPASTGGATTAPSTAATTPATTAAGGGGGGSFCDDAKKLADLDAQATKDINGGVDIVAPGYIAKSMSDSVSQLNAMASHAPADLAAVAKEYFTAYVDYAHEIASVNFVMQPTDPAQQQIVLNATQAYSPIALKDLPLLDAGVQKTCGFGLNLAKAGA
jgi:ABC-type glycerol-3-phosphate transport system substrate-binding protein